MKCNLPSPLRHERGGPEESEEHLVEAFVAHVHAGGLPPKRAKQIVMREVDCYQGRVDVLRAVLGPDSVRDDSTLGRTLVRPSAAAILACLERRKKWTVDDLCAHTGFSPAVIRQRVAELEDLRLIMRSSAGVIRPGPRELPAIEIWSFEAKIDKWRRALYQASQYRGFSHRAFVVMPAGRAKAALANAALFRQLGVGLFLVDNSGALRCKLMVRRTRPSSTRLLTIAIGRVLSDAAR